MSDKKKREEKQKEQRKVYVKPFCLVSKDDASNNMRCGVLAVFEMINGKWLGLTTFELFATTWKANGLCAYDMKESIIGKTAYQGQWQGAQRENITSDSTVMKIIGKIGKVIKENSQKNIAVVEMDPSIDMSGGSWFETCSTPPKRGDKLTMLTL